jgi:hypothetical protein
MNVAAEVERLSERHTIKRGSRSFDLLHIAMAIHWQATAFLSFDAIAAEEGLNVQPVSLPRFDNGLLL